MTDEPAPPATQAVGDGRHAEARGARERVEPACAPAPKPAPTASQRTSQPPRPRFDLDKVQRDVERTAAERAAVERAAAERVAAERAAAAALPQQPPRFPAPAPALSHRATSAAQPRRPPAASASVRRAASVRQASDRPVAKDAEAIRAVGRDADFVRSVLVVAKAYSTMPHAGTLFRSQEAAQMALFAVALRAAGNPLCSGQQQALDRLERLGASALNHRDGCLDGPRAREVLEAGREPLLVHAVKGVARACKKLRAQFLLHGRAPVQEMLWAAGLHAAGEMLEHDRQQALGGLHELRRTRWDRDLSRDRSPSSSRSPTPTPSEGSPGDHPWAPRAASRSPGPAERVPRPAERPGRIPLKAARGANRARSPSEDSASPPPLPLVVTDEPEEPDAGSPAPAPAKKKGRKRSRPSRRKKGRYKKKQS